MSSEPTIPRLEPPLAIRLVWWVGIYLAVQTPIILQEPAGAGFVLIGFPQAMISPYLQQIRPLCPTRDGYDPWDLLYTQTTWIGYVFYGVLFSLLFVFPSRRAFRILMIVLPWERLSILAAAN